MFLKERKNKKKKRQLIKNKEKIQFRSHIKMLKLSARRFIQFIIHIFIYNVQQLFENDEFARRRTTRDFELHSFYDILTFQSNSHPNYVFSTIFHWPKNVDEFLSNQFGRVHFHYKPTSHFDIKIDSTTTIFRCNLCSLCKRK